MKKEKTLSQNPDLFRRLAENAGGILFHMTLPDGKYEYISPACFEISGYEPKEFYDNPMLTLTLVHPEWHAFFTQNWEGLLKGKIKPFYEYKIINRSGQEKWVYQKNVLICDDKGKPAAVEGIITDITETKVIEQRLRETEERYRLITENMNETLWLMDISFTTTYISPSVVRTRGYSLEELKAMPMEEQLTPESSLVAITTLAEELTPERLADKNCEISRRMELEFYRKDGDTFWTDICMTLLRDLEGNPSGFLGVGRDITENKKAEKALKRSEEKYRNIFDNAILGIYRSTPEGTYEEVNQAFVDMVGYSSPDEMMKSITDIQQQLYVNPEDFAKIKHILDKIGYVRGFEAELYYKNGQHVFVSINAKSVRGENGEIIYHEGTVEDITERKQIEKAFKESEKRLTEVLENSQDAVYRRSFKNDAFEYMSPASMRIFGFTQEEMMAMSLEDTLSHFHPDDAGRVKQILDTARVSGGGPYSVEYRFKTKLGDYKWLADKFTVTKDDQGVPLYRFGNVRDITEQKQVEETLQNSEQRYKQLVNLSPDGIIVQKDGIILFGNPEAEKIFGITKSDEYIGKNLFEFLHPDFHEKSIKRKKLLNEGKEVPPFEVKCFDLKGNIIDVEVTLGRIDFQGEAADLNIIRDITSRKKALEEKLALEKQLQQAQKLESIGVLAGGIAHDFNNMLTVIIGNADLAMMELSELSPAVPRLKNINKVSLSAANLCKQMLAYSGKGRFMMMPLNLTEVICEMKTILGASVSKKVKLNYNLLDDSPSIEADLTQLQQVIMNLVINASEAIGDAQGIVNVRTGVIECDRNYLKAMRLFNDIAEGAYVCLEVSDSGCGMDSETMEKIFEPFFTTKFSGRGLGLAAVIGIVRSHNGSLKVYSEPGKGTTFKVLFPVVEMQAQAISSKKKATAFKGSGTVLLVDDEEGIRDFGSQVLGKIGFDVLTAADGLEALELFCEHKWEIKCVILDLAMPRMGGEDTFRELLEIDPDVKVIMTSGYNEIEVMSKFRGKGLAGFIQKPYQIENMKEELKKVLG